MVNLTGNTIHAAIFRQDEKTSFFNEGGRATPKAIRNWANNLRRINLQANGSKPGRPLAATDVAVAQDAAPPARRLRSSVPVRGFIGGESHDGYVVRAREGQTLTARLSWRRECNNRASLSVSETPDFYSAGPTEFGTEATDGRRWSGRVPRTGDYYVYVVAHPSARYTLEVSVR